MNTPKLKMPENQYAELANWVMASCETLGDISQSADYVDRRYLTEEHKLANSHVRQWMIEAGMRTWQDHVGNAWGRYESDNPNAKSLLFGSHLDTVVNGGKYDGMLGVVAPIAIVELLSKSKVSLPYHLDIVGFCDEEGTRFNSTLLGSKALCGQWETHWADIQDVDGTSLAQALGDFGLDFSRVNDAKLADNALLAYVEVHIEQGPILESKDLPVGVVNAIAGARRLLFDVKGMAGHAGTVPTNIRQDALVGASEMIVAIEHIVQLPRYSNVVATVGRINNSPNAVNVISGETEFSLDIRSDNDEDRDRCLREIQVQLDQIANKRLLSIKSQEIHAAASVKCADGLIEQLSLATQEAGIEPFTLFSGAGHDAMAMADICPVGMLFTRCEKGISHHPAEAIHTDDVEATLRVLHHFISSFTAENLTTV